MSQQWESQIRTNLEAPEYSKVLDQAVSAAPGMLAAGLVNTRYEEGCLRVPNGIAAERDLGHLVQLTRGLFPTAESVALPESYAAAFAGIMPVESAHWTTRDERLFAFRIPGDLALVMSISSAVKLGPALVMTHEAARALQSAATPAEVTRAMTSLFEGMNDVIAAAILEPKVPSFGEVYRRPYDRSEFTFDGAMAVVVGQFFNAEIAPVPVAFVASTGARLDVVNAQVANATHIRSWWTVPFDPEHLLFVLADKQSIPQGLVVTVANRATEETVRVWADGLLAWGIDAILEPFPKTQREFLQIVEELRQLHEHDLIARLRVGGFANHTMGEGDSLQRCQECIYYHPHRKWCDLPELPIPVEPHWWCRLWKL
jgi:hypothetical protein